MNTSSIIGLFPVAMLALATFVGFVFFTRCALGYRRSIERRFATCKAAPYRTAEASLEEILEFLEDVGKMALYGVTAIGTLAVGTFATWFALHATRIERHATATDAQFARHEARLSSVENQATTIGRRQLAIHTRLEGARKKDCMLRINLEQAFPGEFAIRVFYVFDGATSVKGDVLRWDDFTGYFPGTDFTDYRLGNSGLIMVKIPIGAKLVLNIDPKAKADAAATCDGSKWVTLLENGHALSETIPMYADSQDPILNPRSVIFRPLPYPLRLPGRGGSSYLRAHPARQPAIDVWPIGKNEPETLAVG